jgi:hypothetical protein
MKAAVCVLVILAFPMIPAVGETSVAAGPPQIDIQKTCQATGSALYFNAGDPAADLKTCMSDEQAAREQMIKNWATYPVRDKSFCAQPAQYMPSYIEWLTCFEMERDLKTIRTGQSPQLPSGQPQDQPSGQSQDQAVPSTAPRSLRSAPVHVPRVVVRKSRS